MKASGSASARQFFRFRTPMPRIDEDRHGADLEEGKGEGEEFRTGRDHEHRPRPRGRCRCRPRPWAIRSLASSSSRKVRRAAFLREDDGRGIRLAPGHLGQMAGDVDDVGPVHGRFRSRRCGRGNSAIERDDFSLRVFKDVVSAIGIAVHLGRGKAPLPFGQEMSGRRRSPALPRK